MARAIIIATSHILYLMRKEYVMKLTDIYPGITINDFFIELRNDDVIINRKEYRLARIYNIPERKYPAFSYDVIFLRNKKVKNLKIDDLIFVPDKFAEEPVS